MVDNSGLATSFRLSIKSVEPGLDPRVTHAVIQALRQAIAELGNLEQTTFSFFHRPQRSTSAGLSRGSSPLGEVLYLGLQFEAPLDKFNLVLRCVASWLDRTAQAMLFEVIIPPVYSLTLQTDQSKVLAQLLPLGEALLPPQAIYLAQMESYINRFGDFTPAVRANLAIARHRVGLSREGASNLNAHAMGPFKTLAEKYQHFRKELLVCNQESDLSGDFWQVMQDKAITMSLPQADVQFLRAERLQALRTEADESRQQTEARAETDRLRQQEQQQRLMNYRQTFEDLIVDSLDLENVALDRGEFRDKVMEHLAAIEFSRGRLTQVRKFYDLSQPEADALEQTVLDELYLLSGLL